MYIITVNIYIKYDRMDMQRVNFHWTHRWSKTYQQTIFYNTFKPKDSPPFNITFYKVHMYIFIINNIYI